MKAAKKELRKVPRSAVMKALTKEMRMELPTVDLMASRMARLRAQLKAASLAWMMVPS